MHHHRRQRSGSILLVSRGLPQSAFIVLIASHVRELDSAVLLFYFPSKLWPHVWQVRSSSVVKTAGAVFLTPVSRAGAPSAPSAPAPARRHTLATSDPVLERRRGTRASISRGLQDPLHFGEPDRKLSPWTPLFLLPASMASLIFAAGFLTFNKVKDKREAKKEKKRKGYEERYSELQREHTNNEEKYQRRQSTGQIQSAHDQSSPSDDTPASKERRASSDSHRSGNDDPSSWVDEVVKQRTGTNSNG